MRFFQGYHSRTSVGNEWDSVGRTENGAEEMRKRLEQENQLGDLCKSICKKSLRLELGEWK